MYICISDCKYMYNSLQYSFKVWLTSALAIPHIYLLYYVLDNGSGAYFPIRGYIELLLECLLFSLPLWLGFALSLDVICKTQWSVQAKKWFGLIILETLLLLLFAIIIHGFGNRIISWASCFDLVVICSCTITACVFLYQLKPVNS